MKKKVLSLLLAVCLIVGMLPLAASAAETDTNVVSPATLHDPTNGVADAKLYDTGSYKVSTQQGTDGIVDVKITATNLQKHANGGSGNLIAYWCGFAVVPSDDQASNVAKVKVAAGNSVDEVNTAFEKATPQVAEVVTSDSKKGFAAYLNADSAGLNGRLYKVQWFQEDGTSNVGKPVTYRVDMTGVELAPETEVLAGYLHDTRLDDEGTASEGIADNKLYSSYNVTSQQKLDTNYGGYYTEVSVAAKDLKEHQNGESKMGYWAGMFAKAPAGATQYKYAFGVNYSDLKTLSVDPSPVDGMPYGDGTVEGIGAYANFGEPGYKTWLKVQWLDASSNALNTTVYNMDFSNSTVSSDAEAPKYTSEIATGVLEDHSGAVAKDQIATGYTLTKGEMVKDTVTGKYYQEVTVSADTLKPQENTQDTVGYWLGFAVAPASAEVTQMKYGFASSLSALSLSSENPLEGAVIGEKSGIAFYANMNDYDTRTLWARVQWLKAGSVEEENIYKINFQVTTKETVGIKDIAVYESDAISDTVTAALGEDGKTITLSGVAPTGPSTVYTLKYTTTAGGAGETKVTYDGSEFTPASFTVLNTEYTLAAGFTTLTNVEIATGDPAVTMTGIEEGDQAAVEAALKAAKAFGLEALTADVAEKVDTTADIKGTAETQLKNAGVSVTGDVHIFVQPYLNIEATGYNKDNGTLELNITAKYQTVATIATDASDIKLGESGKNAVLLNVDGASGDLTVETPVKVAIQLPENFVTDAESLSTMYVKHHDNHYHQATLAGGSNIYTATFTTEGFSPFVFDKNADIVASIGDTYYATLQEAVDAVENSGFITILDSTATATVNKAITFTTSKEVKGILAGTGYEMVVTDNGTGTFTYKFTNAGTSGGGTGGGGTGSTGYTVTVNSTENGTVTASPSSANKGDKVTLTVAPAEGYELGTLTAKDAKGNTVALTKVSDTEYTFVMPDSNVTVSATFVEKNATPFTDVKTADWWYEAVKYVYENKLMAGTSTTTFEPTAKLNRAQAVQILYNLEGQPAVTGTADFTDVSGHWALNAITWGAENNVVAGVGNGKFDPNADVTREQFAQMMYNYAKFKGYDLSAAGDLNSFSDVSKVSDWAVAALTWANGEGLINGNEDGTLAPNGTAIRGQAASIMAKFDQNVAK